jgi:hypothetical protein
MNVQRQLCSAETIEQFLSESLSQAEAVAFERHLDHCAGCRESLEKMAAEESWWNEAREYLAAGGRGSQAASADQDVAAKEGSACTG